MLEVLKVAKGSIINSKRRILIFNFDYYEYTYDLRIRYMLLDYIGINIFFKCVIGT